LLKAKCELINRPAERYSQLVAKGAPFFCAKAVLGIE
jgi:hypothetical protein